MTKNITLAVDEDVLQKVRRYAAEHNTSINSLVRQALVRIADRTANGDKAWDDLFRATDQDGAEVGKISWKRDDLYDR